LLNYILAGLALGSIYAMAAASITVSYVSSGILNFAFGSFAFFLARAYYWLNTQHGWPIVPSALVVLLVMAPALGVLLYAVLLRHLGRCSTLIQVVAMIGLSVALPALALVIFGNSMIYTAPGLAPTPVHVFHPFGATLGLDQVITYAFLVGVLILGTVFLLFTDIGLKVRGLVGSRALASLSGINPAAISVGVWIVSISLAGLTGILVAPSSGLTAEGMTALMSTAFAAVIAARLRSLPVAVVVALLMGLFTDVVQKYLPVAGQWSTAIVSSAPFVVTAVALLYFYLRYGAVRDVRIGSSLDAAIEPQGGDGALAVARGALAAASSSSFMSFRRGGSLVVLAIISLLPLVLHGFWLTLLAGGFVYGLIFLSFTLAIGEGGFLWLSLISFAGLGAVTAAQLQTNAGWPGLVAVIVAAVIVTPIGALLGALTIRFGELYVALATLTFGLLVETLVFTQNRFYQDGLGVPMSRPGFAIDDRAFAYLALALFLVVAIILTNMRRGTTGLAFSAARRSEPAATTVLGLNVIGQRVLISAMSTFVAALGGGLLAMYSYLSLPTSYSVYIGLVWLAVLVTVGIRSIVAAMVAGLAFTIVPGIFQTYLSGTWGNIPTIMFGLGAIGLIIDPDGSVTTQARQVEAFIYRLRHGKPSVTASPPLADARVPVDQSAATTSPANWS
jgi:branched-chain amino acid transport system permease protein